MAASLVAVCLLGRIVGFEYTARRIVEYLLGQLNADVFVYTPMDFLKEASGMDVYSLYHLPRLVKVLVVEEENVTQFLWAAIQQHSTKPGSDVTNPEELWDDMLKIEGIWIGGILEASGKKRRGTGLVQMYAFKRCLDELTTHQQEASLQYDWVVRTRTDLVWEWPHLPIDMFEKNAIWIPEGNDWGGYNDRHALIPLGPGTAKLSAFYEPAVQYLDAWRLMYNGDAVGWLTTNYQNVSTCETDLEWELVRPMCLNHEAWLAIRIKMAYIPVSRYPNFAWMHCGNTSALRWTGTQHNQNECVTHGRPYRYQFEHANVLKMTNCFRSRYRIEHAHAVKLAHSHVDAGDVMAALPHLRESINQCYCDTLGSDSFDSFLCVNKLSYDDWLEGQPQPTIR